MRSRLSDWCSLYERGAKFHVDNVVRYVTLLAMNPNAIHPIIYVRGYAMTQSEIEDTVADPYMGFNIGSCKVRQMWDGKVKKHFFESPLVRLLKQFGYKDVYEEGYDRVGSASSEPGGDTRPCLTRASSSTGTTSLRPRTSAARSPI